VFAKGICNKKQSENVFETSTAIHDYLLTIKGDAVFSDDEEIMKINGVMGIESKATPTKIEKLIRLQKNHGCAFDLDNGFMHRMIDGVDTTFVQ
jgi:hypothetical protein